MSVLAIDPGFVTESPANSMIGDRASRSPGID
jgi:hypothetical protein